MFALCFEERILSRSRCCPQSWPLVQTGAQPGQWGCRAGRTSLIGCLSGHIICPLSTHVEGDITQIGGTDPQMDTLYIVRFFTWRKSICIKMIIPREVSLWPSVTFSPLEIVLPRSLKKKKASEVKEQVGYNLPLLKEVPLPGHLYVNCMWFREEKDATCS